MKILNDFIINKEKGSAITIGNFDGIHLGHKQLINRTKEIAFNNNLNSIVISFNPHPVKVFNPDKEFFYILSQDEKQLLLSQQNIDFFLNYHFNLEFAKTSPEEFITLLINKLNCKFLIVGEDYSFGKNKAGNLDLLFNISKTKGIEIIKVNNISINGEKISSSKIKNFLINKDIKNVNLFLGRQYSILGEVVEGNKLGRTIGFPTANILPKEEKLLPPDSVYITKTLFEGKFYNSITNIGKNPTINNCERTIETHIFDFKQNIYSKNIEVFFYDWVRDVKKFNSIDELKLQIQKDITVVDKFFS